MTIFDWEIEAYKYTWADLEPLGFRIEYDSDKAQVWYKDKYICGHSVKLPREKPLHWKHARENRRENFVYCVQEAQRYANKIGIYNE